MGSLLPVLSLPPLPRFISAAPFDSAPSTSVTDAIFPAEVELIAEAKLVAAVDDKRQQMYGADANLTTEAENEAEAQRKHIVPTEPQIKAEVKFTTESELNVHMEAN
ncbi:hypothetical protein CALCODRAFT_506145 [Calocera cornea HHB12733]|uniref:Uncharacterized protein n=1 Tax=Calocera cornea HHB12733 TaxID=1353952 RepID=A0A165JA88_9BASI|nr:hypothetical protein CALCODRAFT_506145 [Calocera cornea HHB12733]